MVRDSDSAGVGAMMSFLTMFVCGVVIIHYYVTYYGVYESIISHLPDLSEIQIFWILFAMAFVTFVFSVAYELEVI